MNVADLGGAVFSPDDGWLDPHSVLMGLKNKARSMGARFVADEVTGLVRQGHGVSAVRLASGAERTGTVFFRGIDADFATQRDVSRTKRDIKTFEIRLHCDNGDRALAVGMTAYVTLAPHAP